MGNVQVIGLSMSIYNTKIKLVRSIYQTKDGSYVGPFVHLQSKSACYKIMIKN